MAKYVDPKIVPEKKAVDLIAKPSSELLEEGRSPVLNASADRSANTTGTVVGCAPAGRTEAARIKEHMFSRKNYNMSDKYQTCES